MSHFEAIRCVAHIFKKGLFGNIAPRSATFTSSRKKRYRQMNFFALVLFLVFCGTKVHSMPISSEGKQYVRSVGDSMVAPEGQGLNDEDRALLYGDDFVYYISYECRPLYKKCSTYTVCCELSGGGYAVYILILVAIVGGIVAGSCACCPCCPWYEKMCCAARARRAALASAPVAAPAPVAARVKPSVDETGTSAGTMDEIVQ
jgi:hypothetical protein